MLRDAALSESTSPGFGEILQKLEGCLGLLQEMEVSQPLPLLRAMVESTLDTMIAIDVRGIIQHVNPAATRILGYSPEELVGQNVSVLMPEPFRTEHDRYIQDYLQSGKAKVIGRGREVTAMRRDGSEFPADLSVSEFALNGERYFLGVLRDLTETKKLQESLKKSEFLSALGSLVAGVAHAVLNPLQSISGTVNIFERKFTDRTDVAPYLENLRGSTERIKTLVHKLFDLIRTSNLEYHPYSLEQVLSNTVEFCAPIWMRQRQTVEQHLPPDLPLVVMDQNRMTLVFQNVLENALQHTKAGGTVHLRVRLFQPTSESTLWVECSIENPGPGFPQDVLDEPFRPFLTRRPGGTGLGLTISERIVRDHGGKVLLENMEPSGARVRILLPVNPVNRKLV